MACIDLRPFEMKPFHQSIEAEGCRLIRDVARGQTNLIEAQTKRLVLVLFSGEMKTCSFRSARTGQWGQGGRIYTEDVG